MHTRNLLPKDYALAIAIPLVLLAACNGKPTSPPPLEQPKWAAAVQQDVNEALRDVQTALDGNGKNADAVETSLREAEKKLQRLADYNLPLQEAAENCTESYRSASLGHKSDADRQLQEVEKLVLAIAKGESELVAPEFEQPLKLVADTRLALDTELVIPTEQFENLLRRLNQMSLKASLVLADRP